MKITIQDDTHPGLIESAVEQAVYHSRFTADILTIKNTIKISNIRLRTPKHYCGNHPGACRIARKHAKRSFLEGADWVEWNDLLNDVLDRYSVKARVESSVCLVRDGRKRCIEYISQFGPGPNLEWQRIGVYADYCGKQAPPSDFPDGTPGIHTKLDYDMAS